MILYCAADLLWASKIKGTADALGLGCRPVRNLEMLDARLVDSPVGSLIVDLDAGEMALDLIKRVRADPTRTGVRVVAFGPHVDTQRLAEAKRLGADAVMARGAFSARLPSILTDLERRPDAVGDALEE
ncbi:MAG: hypothetical protein K2Q20_07200 [Phycisphaerales bacterium]|nr:hypothetical protein [Phycisphaerales bacterium]